MLNQDKTKLQLFESGIVVNKKLPKWVNVEKAVKKIESGDKKKEKVPPLREEDEWLITTSYHIEEGEDGEMEITPDWAPADPDWALTKDNINYDYLKNADTGKLNVYISKNYGQKLLSELNSYIITNDVGTSPNPIAIYADSDGKKKKSFWAHLFNHKKEKYEIDHYELDILEFFRQVKGITKESAKAYKDRVDGFIIALKNAELTGQDALCEKLLRSIIINRYESVLYANGFYYVITEEQAVDFAKKTEKGVSLDYVKNYVRVIPNEVVKKMEEMNAYEIFDNYVIMHYDPDKKSVSRTIAEEEKKRDPILFGVIKGSRKLYYITDWVDEYCDLTLDKLADVLQVEKDSLKITEEIKI